ncbi:hypothetical protein RhiirA1_542694 [Rhizophagus irregularis]|uniref:Uncharacterized protein n=1 Tax=Rhizophagus irregularis TaxID=588596 RepID=A0A2N0QV71_9GLOM|nr:hypothetical protein RhiirA1_542694 [Rhizophagus irregularis]
MFSNEISSYLDTEFQRKSSPTWIPNSKGNQLLLGYRFLKEISSNVNADIPDKKSAPNWISEFRKKSAPNWIPESRRKSAPNWIPESRKKSAPNWIPEFRK